MSDRPPSVDRLARSLRASGLPHPVLVDLARRLIADGTTDMAETEANRVRRRLLTPVINGTGVLLHTNLGRAPVAVDHEATFSNLELDLETGERGSRQAGIGSLLATATGAEAAMVVNNGAAAVMLVLAALAAGKRAAVSRGELVEIGGGFRIPDVMVQSGAGLVEVGTTNRTRLADFQRAIDAHDDLEVVLHVHKSNYEIVGFTESVGIDELATLDAIVVADIGSGYLDAACPWLDGPPPSWLANEPAARQSLDAGADLVIFSGDKLFGGPQAGIIAGRADLVAACGRHPLARALRPGSLVLDALQTTTLAYLDRRGTDIPFWRMVATPTAELRVRAEAIAATTAGSWIVVDTRAVPGGGTLPGTTFASVGLSRPGDHRSSLRSGERPLIARIENGSTIIDLRTIDANDDPAVIAALAATGDR
ncbi:MAG: L-seryl-tRNA(Sec) selenium transferase [Acidimicrobiales bacterium]